MSEEDIVKEQLFPEGRPFGFLDNLFAPAEDYTGIAAQDWTAAIGIEFLASLIDIPIDFVTTTLGNKVTKGIICAGSLFYTLFTGLRGRAALESLEVTGHFLNEVMDPKPEDIEKLLGDLANFQEGIREKDGDKILKAFIRGDRITKTSEGEWEEVPMGSSEEEHEPIPEEEKLGGKTSFESSLEETGFEVGAIEEEPISF